MAYPRDFAAAARRHLVDGKRLQQDKQYDNAGYHFGLAAECALKGAFIALGDRTFSKEGSGRKAFYAHFPALKNLSVGLSGRISTSVATLLSKAKFMQDWDVKMRYSRNRSITRERCAQWCKDAEDLILACAV